MSNTATAQSGDGERKLEEADIRAVAVEASADPRTVRKVLKGQSVRGMAGKRVRAVLDRMGRAAVGGGAK